MLFISPDIPNGIVISRTATSHTVCNSASPRSTAV